MPDTNSSGSGGTIEAARHLQRKGLTFTEIAAQLGFRRETIVHALYWNTIAGPEYVAPEIETAKLAYAGRSS